MKTSKKNINRAKTYKKKQLYAQLTLPPAGLFRDQLEEVLASANLYNALYGLKGLSNRLCLHRFIIIALSGETS